MAASSAVWESSDASLAVKVGASDGGSDAVAYSPAKSMARKGQRFEPVRGLVSPRGGDARRLAHRVAFEQFGADRGCERPGRAGAGDGEPRRAGDLSQL